MVPMWLVVLLVAALAVGALVVAMLRRPSSEDLHSVRRYHSALGTIEHLSERVGTQGVRPTTRPGGPESEVTVPPVPVRGSDQFPDPGVQVVFDDAHPTGGRPAGGEGATRARADRAQRIALDSMNHRPRPAATVMLVAAVLVLFGVLAYVGSHRSKSSTGQRTTTTLADRPASRSTHRHSAATGRARRPTPTTQPKQLVATTSSPGGTSATYTVPFASYTLTLNASGLSWVRAATVESQATLWSGELTAGSVQAIPATGSTVLEIGAPPVTVSLDGIPVVLPAPLHTPFTATFTSSAAATGSSSSSTTTTTSAGSSPTSTTTAGSAG